MMNDAPSGLVDLMVNWVPKKRKHAIALNPRNLLGAIWLSFLEEVVAISRPVNCHACGNWLVTAPPPLDLQQPFN